MGLEYWHSQWFVGANIYKPIGVTKKYVGETTSQQELITSRGIAKVITTNQLYEEALPGVDAELGYALTESLTSYIGGYYFATNNAATVAGPKIRVTYDYLQPVGRILGVVDGISIEAGAQHDKPRGATAYLGLRFKVGLTSLAKNSNVSGFKRHMVELVKRDPDIIIGNTQETFQETQNMRKYYQEGEHGFIGGDTSSNKPYSERTDYENWPKEILLQELGLPADATHAEVRKVYHDLSLKNHPDKTKKAWSKHARMNRIYTELKNRYHNEKHQKQIINSSNAEVTISLPTALGSAPEYYGGGYGEEKRENNEDTATKHPAQKLTDLDYKYSNLDIERLLVYRLIENDAMSANQSVVVVSPISQTEFTTAYTHKPKIFDSWLKQTVITNQHKIILPIYLDHKEHWITTTFAMKDVSALEVKYFDSLINSATPKSKNWLAELLKEFYSDPLEFNEEHLFRQTDNSVGCGAFAIENDLLGLNIVPNTNWQSEKELRNFHYNLLSKYQNQSMSSIIAKIPTVSMVNLSFMSLNITRGRSRGGRKTKVAPDNEPPVVSDIYIGETENTIVEFTEEDFIDKFSDPEGDSLIRIKVTSLPSNGALKLSGTDVEANQEIVNGDLDNITFEPAENWVGSTSFGWKGYDGYVYSTDAASVNISIAETFRPVLIGSLDTDGYARGVAVAGGYAYVADYDKGLKVINIADPSSPELVGSLDTDGEAIGVAVAGGYAYVANYDKGLKVINIADLSSPELVGSLDTDGNALGVAVAGEYVYVADYDRGLKVINITNSSSPELVGSLDTDGYVWSVAVAGGYAYVADYTKGLKVINIANPSSPELVGSCDTDGSAIGVAIVGEYAYVADQVGLKIINVADHSSLQLVGSLDTDGYAYGVAVAGDYAYMADYDKGLAIINIVTKAAPILVGSLDTDDEACGIAVVGNYAYVSDGNSGLKIIENKSNELPVTSDLSKAAAENTTIVFNSEDFTSKFTDPNGDSLVKIKVTSLPDYGALKLFGADVVTEQKIVTDDLNHLTFEPEENWYGDTSFSWKGCDGYLYAAAAEVNISIVVTLAPVLVGSCADIDGSVKGVAVDGNYAYVANGEGGLKIINVAAPTIPELVGGLDIDGYARGVAVGGNHAYVADGWSGLKIINVAIPTAPELISSLDTDGSAIGTTLAGSYVYLADESKGLKIVNVTTPATPELTGGLDTDGNAWGVAIAGDYAYVADGESGLKIVNVTIPSSPNLVGSLNTDGSAKGVAIAGNYTYVADGSSGLKLIDVTNSTSPRLVSNLNTDDNAYGVVVTGNYTYIADGEGGLKIINTAIPTSPVLVGDLDTDGVAYAVAGDYTYLADGESGLKVIKNNNYPVASDVPKSVKVNTTVKFGSEDFTSKFTDLDNDSLTKVQITSLPSNGVLKLAEVNVEADQEIITEDLAHLTFEPEVDWYGTTNFGWKGYDGYVYSKSVANVNISIVVLLSPVLVSSLDTDGDALGVAVAGEYAYVADGDSGLKVVHIADPSSPELVGSLDTDGSAGGVAVAGGYAYVADHAEGLKVISIANPSSPELIGSCDTDGYAWGVAVAGEYAYVADDEKGLKVINIANPSSPELAGSLDTDSYARDVAVAGEYAYVADGYSGLKVISIADSSSPELVGSCDTDGYAWGVAVAGEYAYVADDEKGLKVISIANPSAPKLVGSLAIDSISYNVVVVGEYAYVANGNAGLKSINIATSSLPELVGSLDTDGTALDLAVVGDYTYLADSNKGLKIIRNNDIPPVVSDITKSESTNNTIVFSATDFTSKFTDEDGDSLSKVKTPSLPNNGTLALSGAAVLANQEIEVARLGDLAFDPELNWHGTTNFDWQGEDGYIYSKETAKVNILIDTPPVVSEVIKSAIEAKTIEFSSKDFTDKFTDADGDSLTKIQITSLPNSGVLELVEEDVVVDQEIAVADLDHLTFAPESSKWHGKTSFNWQGNDGFIYSTDTAKVTVEVANTPPVIGDISKIGEIDQILTFEKTDFTDEFTDANDDSLTRIKIVSLPEGGGQLKLAGEAIEEGQKITVDELEDITFTPEATWAGKTSFSWKGYDGTDYSKAANVKIEIIAENFCVRYWWVCYLIPSVLAVTGITISVGLGILNYYYRKHKNLAAGNVEDIELVENSVFGANI